MDFSYYLATWFSVGCEGMSLSARWRAGAVVSIWGAVAVCLPAAGVANQSPARRPLARSSENTLFIKCQENPQPERVLSPVSVSEDGKWRAYVTIDVDSGCLQTARLWVAQENRPYRLVYLMPPRREMVGNGMQILGWARKSRMVLVETDQWQNGSDAPDLQGVFGLDAATGMVFEPNLDVMLENRNGKQCTFRVTDAGFSSDGNVNILVRAKFFTSLDVEETEQDVAPEKRCGNHQETWSFNFANGEMKQLENNSPLLLYKKFLPNPRVK
jgi:hypothetical protein